MKIDKLNFIGFIEGNTGYSVLSRALISLMDFAGIDIRVGNLNRRAIREFVRLQQKDPKDRFQLLHQIPTVRPDADGYYTVTEFDQPPYGSASILRRAKWILTESEFCKEVFEEFTNAPIDVIHYPLDPQYKPNGTQFKFSPEIEKFKFKFLYVFEWLMRKDPYTLIKAFAEEFSPDEDVCLILRCWSKFENPRKWLGWYRKKANIFWISQDLPHLSHLYRSCDCFVTPTLGEGCGHPIMEAMGCGLKVIAPKSTGILDYANSKNAILIPVEEKFVHETTAFREAGNEIPHLIKPWFKCWEPDKEALKKAMRRAFKNEMKFIRSNAVKIRDKFGIENALNEIKVAFEIE